MRVGANVVTLEEVGGWAAVLGALTSRRDITSVQAGAALAEILEGSASPAQMAAFMVALRMKGETVEEMSGMLATLLAFAEPVPLPAGLDVVDTCGTGGDRSHTINVSTIAAFIVAGADAPVCKHGNRAASSTCCGSIAPAFRLRTNAAANSPARFPNTSRSDSELPPSRFAPLMPAAHSPAANRPCTLDICVSESTRTPPMM